jgi:hypothetical protein
VAVLLLSVVAPAESLLLLLVWRLSCCYQWQACCCYNSETIPARLG